MDSYSLNLDYITSQSEKKCSIKLVVKIYFVSLLLSNRVTGVYEVTLCHVADNGSPGENEIKENNQ